MNGLIPKRSCVNPVLITTFGLEPPGQKNEGEGAEAVERSDRKGLGNTFPNQYEGATGHKKMRVKERRPGSEATEGDWGNRSPIKQKVPSGHKKMRVKTLIFLCPKPGSNRHVFLRTLDFESNASTNSAIRANGLRKNALNRLDFAKILQKAELSKCGKR